MFNVMMYVTCSFILVVILFMYVSPMCVSLTNNIVLEKMDSMNLYGKSKHGAENVSKWLILFDFTIYNLIFSIFICNDRIIVKVF